MTKIIQNLHIQLILIISLLFFCRNILCGFSNVITQEEKGIILELRALYSSRQTGNPEADEFNYNWVNSTGDMILRNWVQYYDNDLAKIEVGLDKSLDFRRVKNLNKNLDWIPPKYIDENFPWHVSGYTRDGQPIFYIHAGIWPIREALQQNLGNDLLKYMTIMTERVLSDMKERNDVLGLDAGNVLIIVDIEGFSISQIASLRVLRITAVGFGILQTNYPFIHSELIGINIPTIFKAVLDVAKQVLSERTFGRIFVYNSNRDNWLPHLQRVVPKAAFPKELL